MKTISKNIKKSLLIILMMFILLIIYISFSVYRYSDRWFSDPSNSRVNIDMTNPSLIPGMVLDRNMKVLVESKSRIENGQEIYYRQYSRESKYASHVIGSRQLGIGVESHFIRSLLGYDNSMLETIYQKMSDDKEKGNNVILTIDIELQKYAYDLLANEKGAILLLNPKNGEILAMVSSPAIDLQNTNNRPEGETLVNKVTQGMYPPGSIMKLVTASALLEQKGEQGPFVFNCNGQNLIDDIKINCAGTKAHGLVDLPKALELSCNGYFAQVAINLGRQGLKDMGERFGFNKDFLFNDFICGKSVLELNKNTKTEELAWSGIGQAEVLVTPLHMALLVSSIGNNGNIPEPRLLHAVQKWNGEIHYRKNTKPILKPISPQTANELKGMMVNVVEQGTGKEAYRKNLQIAGKTGTAQVGGDKLAHAWFVGLAPAENPSLAIVVLIENSGSGGKHAAPIAADLLEKATKLGY